MARLLTVGFWTKSANLESGITTFETSSPIRSGIASQKCDSGVGNSAVSGLLKPTTLSIPNATATYVWFTRFYVFLSSSSHLPTADIAICRFLFTADFGVGTGIKLTSTGALKAVAGANESSASAQTIPLGEWVRIEFKTTFVVTVSTSREETVNAVFVNGVDQSLTATYTVSNPSPGVSSISPEIGWITAPGANKIIYFADCAWNNDQGAAQNSYPGDEKYGLLLPISDNARATLWTGGAGGTTSLFEAVNNTPPIGTATETDLTQIEHAGGAAGTTDAYNANMTRYIDIGIKQTDKINVMQFIEVDGEDSATGTKLLNFEVLSNPVMASPGNVTAGNDIGALGTYASNWAIHYSGMTYNPAVNINTSPVMRARRPETATRVASICFMGIIVSYTPMGENSVIIKQAVNRASTY